MRMPPLPADSIHARACKLKCEKILTRPGGNQSHHGTQFDSRPHPKSKEAGKHLWGLPALITARQDRAGRSMAAHLCAAIDGPDWSCYLPNNLKFTTVLRYIISNMKREILSAVASSMGNFHLVIKDIFAFCSIVIYVVPIDNSTIPATKTPLVFFNKCNKFINKVIH